ncbi:tandem-95 repeat protein [Shewanella mesophila]|nr:Ig-like domain-containing protein [Shewanella mesophila]QYJ86453.1 tandem-95 repeat protein [Shewanella mesophila]
MKSLVTAKNGHVTNTQGNVSIQSDTGSKVANVGDYVPAGTKVSIPDESTLEIAYQDGSTYNSSELSANEINVADTDALNEIEQLQALIAAGDDPTQSLPETASGGTQGNEGGSDFVSLARTGAQTLAESGYSSSLVPQEQTVINQTSIPNDETPTIAINDSNTIAEDTVATGNVLDNDSDIDSDLSVVSLTVNGETVAAGTTVEVEGGSLVINTDGSYTFTPNDNWNGSVPVITYTTNTGASATLTIEVTPVDDASVLANDSNTIAEDTLATGNVLDNDSDIDSDLSVVSFTVNGETVAAGTTVEVEGGSLVINADGTYTFTPNDNWNGSVPVITYTTNTGASATLTIEVTPVDDASVLANDSNTIAEDTLATGNVLDNDSDIDSELSVVSFTVNGETVSAGTTVEVEGGSLVINTDGTYTFTPNDNWNGSVPVITYTTNTGASATLTIEVTPVDDASVLANDSNTIAEDTLATGNVLDNDSDIDSELSVVSFTVNGETVSAGTTVEVEGGSLVINTDGSYTFTPNDNWNGSVPVITYTTNTGASATLTIEVTPVDDASVLANDSNTIAEDTLATGNVLDNDSDIDSDLSVVSFTVNGETVAAGTTVEVEGGSLVINADGTYTFTPNDNWNGSVPVITYTTNTGASATLTIEVTPVDDASVLANDSNTIAEDTLATGNVLDNDSDIDSDLSVVSFTVNSETVNAGTTVELEGGSVVINADGTYTFTPNDNWNGSVPVITYTTNTGASATLTIEVTPVDDAPTIDVVANDFTENSAVAGDVAATYTTFDEDGDALTVDFTLGTNNDGYYALVNGVVVLTQAGADLINNGGTLPAIDLTVSDGLLTGQDSDTPVITTTNDAPTIDVVANDFTENSAVAGDVAATYTTFDEDGDALTVDFTLGTNNDGYYALVNGVVVLTQAGADLINNGGTLPAIDLTVSDGLLTGQDSDTPVITTTNDAPTIDVVANDFTENSAVAGDVAATYTTFDEDGDALTVDFTLGTNNDGYYALVNGVVVLTQAGADLINNGGTLPAIDLTVSDGLLTGQDSDTPVITTTNDAPTIDVVANDFTENSAVAGDVAATYTTFDEDGDALTVDFTLGTNNDGYYALVNGVVVLTQAGADLINNGGTLPAIDLTVSDGLLTGQDSDTPVITTTNDAPTIDVVANDFTENSAVAGDVAATYTTFDEDGDALTVDFTLGTNNDGYYALVNGVVVLTQAGADLINNGGTLPAIDLTVSDGLLTGQDSDTPVITTTNDAPTIDVVANDFTENSAVAGDVAATYTTFDEDGDALTVDFTLGTNNDGYYALVNGVVVLTQAGADLINNGGTLPAIDLTVSDGLLTGQDSDTPVITTTNDAPTIDVVANDFTENSAVAGDVAATYTTFDEDGDALTVDFTLGTNNDGYYALVNGVVVLTQAGADLINNGGTLPAIDLTVSDGLLTGQDSDTPVITTTNDAPTIDVVANDFTENSAVAGDVAATYTTVDEDGDALTVDFTLGTNNDGYYALVNGVVVLTQAGADLINNGGTLPAIDLTVSDGLLTGQDSDTPVITTTNDAPTIDVVANDFTENSAVAGDVAATYTTFDEDGDALTVDFTLGTNNDGYYALVNGVVVLTQAGADLINNGGTLPAIDLTVSDGLLTGQDSDTPVITTTNDAPTIDVVANDFTENSAVAGDVAATYTTFDEDGDALTVDFTLGTNNDGYYALVNGVVVLTQAGADLINNGGTLPAIDLTVSDGLLTGQDSDTPVITTTNDAPTIDVVANDFTENSAVAGDVAATYTTFDEDGDALTVDFTLGTNNDGYYALVNGVVVLTQAGADLINNGGTLPAIDLTVSDGLLTGQDSDTPVITTTNDAPTIDVVANDFTENSAVAGDVAATYTTFDEDGDALTVDFTLGTNNDGYYALVNGVVVLTQAGADLINNGGTLPAIDLTVSDGLLTGQDSDTPVITTTNDAPTIDVVANDFTENSAVAGDVAATYTTFDEDGDALTVDFTLGTNNDGYYALVNGVVVLTQAGADLINNGGTLPAIDLTVSDGLLTGQDSDTPVITTTNDAPTIDVVANDFTENSAVAGDVAATYTTVDEDGDALTVDFTLGTNNDGYYALVNGVVVLTQAGADLINNGGTLPAIDLTVSDGLLTGQDSDTPVITTTNDAPTIDVVANDFTENSAVAGDVAATYTTFDEDGDALTVDFTLGTNNDGYYALVNGVVVLTQAGADLINNGGTLPAIDLTVSDGLLTGQDSDTPVITTTNDAPTIDVVANDFTENSAVAGDVAATYTTFDEDGDALTVDFTLGTNNDGYYALVNGVVVLTQAGADLINNGGTLPAIDLTVSDGLLTGQDSDTPVITTTNDAPTIDVVANDFTENSAVAGDVAATYTTVDEDGDALTVDFTLGTNNDGYYALVNGVVVLTQAGADLINNGGTLPAIDLTVSDGLLTGQDSDTPVITTTNDAPTIDVVANDFTENSAVAGDVAATYTTFDEDGDALTVDFTLGTNNDGYYALVNGVVVLTQAGADLINNGGTLPAIDLTVSDGLLTGQDSDTPVITTTNDAPTIDVVANDFTENSAVAGDVAATYTTFDEDGDALTVDFTLGTNNDGYYALVNGVVVLTQAGADLINNGGTLPAIDLTVSDGLLTGQDSDTPVITTTNDAPTIDVVANDFTENSAVAGDVAATYTTFDEDGDALTVDFTLGTNNDGYYALVNGVVVLTQAGADLINNGGTLPAIDLTVSDGLLTGQDSDTPVITTTNDAPTIDVVANDFTENSAVAGDVAATYTTVDEDGDALTVDFTLGTNNDGYYALVNGVVVLTQAGADLINNGGTLPAIDLTVSDGLLTGQDSDTPVITTTNDAPTIDVVANDFTENSAVAGDVAATYTTFDEDGDALTVDFTLGTNNDGYYALVNGVVVLTQAGADLINNGGTLPAIDLTVSDGLLTGQDSDTPVITTTNDAPTIDVVANDFTENSAVAGDVAATYTTFDEDGDALTVDFTLGTNNDGYYALVNGVVVLTQAGADLINNGGTLPAIDLTVSDGLLTGQDSDTPVITTTNDAPTIDVVANDFTENSAVAGDVAATYTTFDEDGDALTVDFTLGTNNDGYYALVNGVVVLTQAGADLINNGGTLPAIDLTVSDGLLTGQDSDTPVITTTNDAPTIDVVANDFTENSAVAGDVAATYTTFDEDGDALTVDFTLGTNNDGYYALVNGVVVLTQAGADLINNGGTLPAIDLTVSDGLLTGQDSDTPVITTTNDAPTIDVVANDFTENSAVAGDVAATYTTFDEDGDALTVDFTLGTNNDGYYALVNGVVVLTQTGADLINNGGTLPAIDLTVSDGLLTGQDSDTPVITATNDTPVITSTTNSRVSEEGLPDGITDTSGNTDTTNSVTASGTINIDDADGDALTVSLSGPTNITSSGDNVQWSWDGTNTLTGYVGTIGTSSYTAVMTVVLTAPENGSSGAWSYDVTLLAPVDHADTGSEDNLSLDFGVTVSDGNGASDIGDFTVIIEDDAPEIADAAAVAVSDTDIPDTLVGSFSFTNSSGSHSLLDFDGFTVTANGFTSSTNSTLTASNIYGNSSGIGVQSVNSPYLNLAGEVDFRQFADGTSASEEVIITLDAGKLAYGVNIEFNNMFFGGELEVGVVDFYRDGQLVGSQTFSSNSNSGDYAERFNVLQGGFDQMVIRALDNGVNNSGDNSDFAIKAIEFLGYDDIAFGYATGTVDTNWGADGKGSLVFDGTDESGLFTSDGQSIVTSLSGNTLLGQTDSGELVFKVEFTPSTGQWEFYQYKAILSPNDGQLDFNITATDADGDSITGHFAVIAAVDDNVSFGQVENLNVDESALISGSGAGQLTDSGVLNIIANDGLAKIEITNGNVTTTVTLSSLLAATPSTPIVIAAEHGSLIINSYNNGIISYNYSLSEAQTHSNSGVDIINDNFAITAFDIDGDTAFTTLTTNIYDDIGTAHNDFNSLNVTVDSFFVNGVEAVWTSHSGGLYVNTFDGFDGDGGGGNDNDNGHDQIRWGSTNGLQSGYGFIDNDAALNGEIPLNQDIVLGTFTHYNYPISSGTAITDATMQITFTVFDASGVPAPVTMDIEFNHNETPNSGDNPEDIITIGSTNVTFNYEGNTYTIQVIGFMDDQGNIVQTIYTDENAATSYQVVVRIAEGDGYSLPSTEGNVLSNDITGADTAVSIIGVTTGDETSTGTSGNVAATIHGTYGNLVLNADGTYTYTITTNASDIPNDAVETFTYTMQDGDGDTSSALLSINVNIVDGNGVPIIDAKNIAAEGSSLNDDFIVINGEKGSAQDQLNINFGGNKSGVITNAEGDKVSASGANLTSYSSSNKQVVSSGDGNDHIETAKGDDIIYAGKTGSAGYGSDNDLELSISEIQNHHIMTGSLKGHDSIVDNDGILLANDVASQKADVVNGGSGNDHIYGQSGSDILYGHTGNDHIEGGDHNDGLRGGAGNDILVGGLGDDVLRGDNGSDIFVWQQGDTGTDHITDFNVNQDKLDLSDLLQGEDTGNLANYLHFTVENGSTTIEVDANDDGNVDQMIVLDGVNLFEQLGVSSDAEVINSLLNSNGESALIISDASASSSATGTETFNPLSDHDQLHSF